MADTTAAPASSSNVTSPAAAPTATPASAPAMSLQDLKKQHAANMAILKTNAQKAHQQVGVSATAAAVIAARDTNAALQEVFANEQQLEAQVKELAVQSEHFKKRMQQWSQHFLKLNQAMKEIGDVHNWSQSIHQDVESTLTILDEVSAKKRKALGLGAGSSDAGSR